MTTKAFKKYHVTGDALESAIGEGVLRDLYFDTARVRHIKMRDQYRI